MYKKRGEAKLLAKLHVCMRQLKRFCKWSWEKIKKMYLCISDFIGKVMAILTEIAKLDKVP